MLLLRRPMIEQHNKMNKICRVILHQHIHNSQSDVGSTGSKVGSTDSKQLRYFKRKHE